MNQLDAANAAPLASDSERSGAKMMLIYAAVLVVGFIVAIAAGVHFVKKYDAHEKQVGSIKDAPVVLPPIVVVKKQSQIFTKNEVAKPTVKDYLTVETPAPITKKQAEPLTPAEQDFANRLATFESKL